MAVEPLKDAVKSSAAGSLPPETLPSMSSVKVTTPPFSATTRLTAPVLEKVVLVQVPLQVPRKAVGSKGAECLLLLQPVAERRNRLVERSRRRSGPDFMV